jgi:hypothetical protein
VAGFLVAGLFAPEDLELEEFGITITYSEQTKIDELPIGLPAGTFVLAQLPYKRTHHKASRAACGTDI